MFTTILVPVDGSEASTAALAVAVEMAKAFQSELIILTVYRHHSLLEHSTSMVRPEEPEAMDDIMRAHAAEVAEHAKAKAVALGGSNARAFVKNGPPARTIVAFAKDRDADLIVLGSRGVGDLDGFLLGSVSHKVTGLSVCPVMVV